MRELRRKTGTTLFVLLSFFLLAVLLLLNVRAYAREAESVRRNLNVLEERKGAPVGDPWAGKKEAEKSGSEKNIPEKKEPERTEDNRVPPDDIRDMMIMDYELYTATIKDGQVTEINSHGEVSEDFDVYSAAEEILKTGKKERSHTGNLYFSSYSWLFHGNETLVILNDKEIRQKLWGLLAESLVLLIAGELGIVLISKLITGWITKPAEEAFTRQKEFIADASHELKTPLAVIMASADELKVSDEEKKYLDNIRYESDRMSRLISGLLGLSRLENSEGKAAFHEEDISLLAEKTCMAYEAVAFEKGVAVETEIGEGLLYSCNRDEIEQMMATLLDNAVRHSYRDTTVRIKLSRGKGKNSIVLQVMNTGDPIPEEDRKKIFERFYRGDKARGREENHYGLGLAIAKRIAQNHNGDIEAFSEGGETVFRVMLG